MKQLTHFAGEIRRRGLGRWALILAATAAGIFLASTMETGRAHADGVGFRFIQALVRIITPNVAGRNNFAILCLDNPKDSDVTGTIYDLRGMAVSGMIRVRNGLAGCPASAFKEALTWDGRSGGMVVASGIYVYQVQAEEMTVTGTFVVGR